MKSTHRLVNSSRHLLVSSIRQLASSTRRFRSSTHHWPPRFVVVCRYAVSSFRYGILSFRCCVTSFRLAHSQRGYNSTYITWSVAWFLDSMHLRWSIYPQFALYKLKLTENARMIVSTIGEWDIGYLVTRVALGGDGNSLQIFLK